MSGNKIAYLKAAVMMFLSCFFLNAFGQEVPMSGSRHLGSEEENKPKKEMSLVLPAFPKDEDLLPFYVSPIQTQKFTIDEKSLLVGEDEIRYTLVGTSSAGAKNITYEGIKCDSGMMRRYAIGRYDGTWTLSKHDEWKDIHFRDANRPQAALVLNYFCQGKAIASKRDQMIFRIRHNRSLQTDKYDHR